MWLMIKDCYVSREGCRIMSMRKPLITMTVMVLMGGLLTLCFTQAGGMRRGAMGEQGMRIGKEKMMAVSPMYGMMTGPMMVKSIAATGDGGIFVMAGNKLIKYEQDLNLVKETEVKINGVRHAETDEPEDGAMSYVQAYDARR
jgi:hypothetical protein